MFVSIQGAWLFVNENGFDLGTFCRRGRAVVPIVPSTFSRHVPEWIDLIFGFANTGRASVKANNTFRSSSFTRDVLKDRVQLQIVKGTPPNSASFRASLFRRRTLRVSLSLSSQTFLNRHFPSSSITSPQRPRECGLDAHSDFDFRTLGSIAPFTALPEDDMPDRSGRFVAGSLLLADGATRHWRCGTSRQSSTSTQVWTREGNASYR
jgi:hypothetical protein